MANYYADVLKVKAVYFLDDSGAYGVGMADAFEKQAGQKGMKVIGRRHVRTHPVDKLDPDPANLLIRSNGLHPLGRSGRHAR